MSYPRIIFCPDSWHDFDLSYSTAGVPPGSMKLVTCSLGKLTGGPASDKPLGHDNSQN